MMSRMPDVDHDAEVERQNAIASDLKVPSAAGTRETKQDTVKADEEKTVTVKAAEGTNKPRLRVAGKVVDLSSGSTEASPAVAKLAVESGSAVRA